MKYFILFLGWISAAQSLAAQHSVGIHLQPQLFWMYNREDWQEPKPDTNQVEMRMISPLLTKPNAFYAGVSYAYQLNNYLAIETGLYAGRQTQVFQVHPGRLTNISIENTAGSCKLMYLKIPILLQWDTQPEDKVSFCISAGLNTSFLATYEEHIQLFSDRSRPVQDYDFLWKNTSYNDISTYWRNGQPTTVWQHTLKTNYAYRRFVLGGLLKVGVRAEIVEDWLLHIALQGSYDFTNAENLNVRAYSTDSLGNTQSEYPRIYQFRWGQSTHRSRNRTPVHNIHAGLTVGVSHSFGGGRRRW